MRVESVSSKGQGGDFEELSPRFAGSHAPYVLNQPAKGDSDVRRAWIGTCADQRSSQDGRVVGFGRSIGIQQRLGCRGLFSRRGI